MDSDTGMRTSYSNKLEVIPAVPSGTFSNAEIRTSK